MTAYTLQALHDMLGEYLSEYPAMADEHVRVEDEHGLLDFMHVMSVECVDGQVELVIDRAGKEPVVDLLRDRKHAEDCPVSHGAALVSCTWSGCA